MEWPAASRRPAYSMRTIPVLFAGKIYRLGFTPDGRELFMCNYSRPRGSHGLNRIDIASGASIVSSRRTYAEPACSAGAMPTGAPAAMFMMRLPGGTSARSDSCPIRSRV